MPLHNKELAASAARFGGWGFPSDGKWVYPAYGESPRRQAPKEDHSILTALIEAAR